MGKLERINQAELEDVLTTADAPLQKRCSETELRGLGALMESMARRWPQEIEDSVGAYYVDMKQLVLREGLETVSLAVSDLRVEPGQKFFPRPDEIAHQIEKLRAKREAQADVNRANRYLDWLHEEQRICLLERAEERRAERDNER